MEMLSIVDSYEKEFLVCKAKRQLGFTELQDRHHVCYVSANL